MSTAEATPRLSLGAILSHALSILGLHPAGLVVTSFVVVFVPSLSGEWLSGPIADAVAPEPSEGGNDPAEIVRGLIAILPDGLCAFGTILIVAIVVHAAIAKTEGATPGFAAHLRAGLRDYPRCAVAATIIALIAAAASLLIFPSLVITSLWGLVLPVMVAERASLAAAFGRSRTLTRGHRRAIVGWALPLALLWGASKLMQHVDAWYDVGDIAASILGIIGAGVKTALALVASACLAATYLELRRIEDGPGPAAGVATPD